LSSSLPSFTETKPFARNLLCCSIFARATVVPAGTAKRVLAMVILSVSVCLSVCLSRPGTESSPGQIESPGFHRVIA